MVMSFAWSGEQCHGSGSTVFVTSLSQAAKGFETDEAARHSLDEIDDSRFYHNHVWRVQHIGVLPWKGHAPTRRYDDDHGAFDLGDE
jgi:hypothetical protein